MKKVIILFYIASILSSISIYASTNTQVKEKLLQKLALIESLLDERHFLEDRLQQLPSEEMLISQKNKIEKTINENIEIDIRGENRDGGDPW